MNRVICIWLPEWPVQRLLAARPELKSTPCVLHVRDARRGRVVVGCSPQVRAWGVQPGIPLAEVATFAGRNGPIEWIEYQPQLDRETLAELAAWCERWSPLVGLEEGPHPTSLLLDATGLAPHFGGEPAWGTQITREFARRGYVARVAIASTLGGAWALAHFATSTHPTCCQDEMLFEVAAPQVSPSSRSITPSLSSLLWVSQTLPDDLLPLPPAALRIPAEPIGLLHELGIETIGGLLQLPRAGLAPRLGTLLMRRLDQALGQVAEVITAHRPPIDFQVAWPLEYPTYRRDVIERILHDLCQQLGTLLRDQDRGAVQLEAWLDGTQGAIPLRIGLYQANASAQHWFDLLRLRLETIQASGLVHQVRLLAVTTVKLVARQQTFWDEEEFSWPKEVGLLVDRLQSRLGSDRVYGVQTQASALPEKAFYPQKMPRRGRPISSPDPRSGSQPPTTPLRPHQRPLTLLNKPWPVVPIRLSDPRESDEDPEQGEVTGPPACFQWQHCRFHITQAWGPERIETGWWRGQSIRRDYYRIETTSGARFWLFQRLNDGRWFVQGGFD